MKLEYIINKIIEILKEHGCLSLRELCMFLNNKTDDYCRGLKDGMKCKYVYTKDKKLKKPDCKIPYIRLIYIVNKMEKMGLIRTEKVIKEDNRFRGKDRFRIVCLK